MASKIRVTHVSFSQNHFMKFIHIHFLTLTLTLTIKLALNLKLTPNPKAIFNPKPNH